MVRASRSQLALSSGAVVAICPRICSPVRKSFRLKAVSASLRKEAGGFETGPASLLIWVSSLIAESAKSSRLKALSAACAATRPNASVAQIVTARTKPIMMELPGTDECRLLNRNARKGDKLMAAERDSEKSHATWPQGKSARIPEPDAQLCNQAGRQPGPPPCLVDEAIKMVRNGLGGVADFSYWQW